jgi:maltooligosyltrehalose trehalohydrolase
MKNDYNAEFASTPTFLYGPQSKGDETIFRLWAPSATEVTVCTLNGGKHPMTALPGGWYEATVACAGGTEYRFEAACRDREDLLTFADPASHAQSGTVDGASVVINHDAYLWKNVAWTGRPWHEMVLYELHVGLHGGFSAMSATLPRLASLGITAIELMPVAAFPGERSWGYDGVLPFAPDSTYGTPDELKSLIDTAHGLGMSVFLDVVYNHFGPQGNYLHSYASDFFRSDLQTPWGDGIDFRRAEVRDFFTANAIHWLRNYRFDGLRFDAVHAIKETDWLREAAKTIRTAISAEFGPKRQVHLVAENEDNRASILGYPADPYAFNAQWNDDWHNVMHVLLTGESEGYYKDFVEEPTEKLARSLAEGFIYQGEPAKNRDGEPRGEETGNLSPMAFVNFLQNHDQTGNRAFGDRLTTLTDPRALKVAQALLLLTPYIPLLFMGEEIGAMTPFLFFTGYDDEDLSEAIRKGRQKEFSHFPSFTDQEVLESIPDPNDVTTYHSSNPNVKNDHAAARQWMAWTKRLLEVRAESVVPGIPGATSLNSNVIAQGAITAAWALGNDTTLVVIFNLSGKNVRLSPAVALPETLDEVIFDTGGVLHSVFDHILPAYSFMASVHNRI